MTAKTILTLAALAASTGCTLAPRYTRPDAPVPGSWSADAALPPAAAEAPRWQDHFPDPGLRAVVDLALANNRDLRVAVLNVERAQALYRIQRSELFPDAGVMGDGLKRRVPEAMAKDGVATVTEQYTVQAGVLSWELDLFGRLRSLKNRALNQYLATEAGAEAARIALVAAVTQAYYTCVADRENLALAQATFEAQKSRYDLIAQSRAAGIASELDLRQAESQMEAARADLARFRGLVAVDLNALDLLVGTRVPPERLPQGMGPVASPKTLSPGLPSDVLLQRPDIRAAEFQLRAAYANIGTARAAFFPRITLTGGLGSMSPELSGLFEAGTRTWSFTPQVTVPLFAGGSLWANLKVSKVDREIALAQYEKAIQTAFREVSDGLVRQASLQEQVEAQQALVTSLEASHKLSELRYREGLDGYLGVLIAQRSLYAAQQGLVATRLAVQTNQVTLFKALGGRL